MTILVFFFNFQLFIDVFFFFGGGAKICMSVIWKLLFMEIPVQNYSYCLEKWHSSKLKEN